MLSGSELNSVNGNTVNGTYVQVTIPQIQGMVLSVKWVYDAKKMSPLMLYRLYLRCYITCKLSWIAPIQRVSK